MDNFATLTRQKKAIQAKKRQKGEVKEILFDDDARREYLTGFHKRNIAKKEAKAAKAKERQRQERLDLRREKRRELAERALNNKNAVELAYKGSHSADEMDDMDGEPSSSSAKDEDIEFEGEEQLATVTIVEDFDLNQFDQPDPPSRSSSPQNNYSKTSQPSTASRLASGSTTQKTIKKRPAYETKAARAASKTKQRARRTEKMERAKSRQKIKGARHRRK